jgi:hypothetical protein
VSEEVTRWRRENSSTIRNILVLAKTAYLNVLDPVGKKIICQRILADIRKTRPAVMEPPYFWLGEQA